MSPSATFQTKKRLVRGYRFRLFTDFRAGFDLKFLLSLMRNAKSLLGLKISLFAGKNSLFHFLGNSSAKSLN